MAVLNLQPHVPLIPVAFNVRTQLLRVSGEREDTTCTSPSLFRIADARAQKKIGSA